MAKNYKAMAAAIPMEDRPISKKNVSGLGNFFGIYGGRTYRSYRVRNRSNISYIRSKGNRYFHRLVYWKYPGNLNIRTDLCTNRC